MTPPPKPETLSEETLCWAVANGPRLASRIAVVGFGPRSYGLAACAAVAPVSEPATRARVAAAVTRKRRARCRAGMVGDCTSDSPRGGWNRRASVFGRTRPGHIGEITGLDIDRPGSLSVTRR